MASQSPARRRSLRLIAQSLAALSGGSAFSALAQGTASPSGFGTPASTAQRIGTGLAQIALLVPPSNGVYQRAGEALIEGMRAAQARDDVTAVEVIEVGESGFELHQLCATLRERGFALAIGPLTRNAVTGLATGGPPALPVLALNQADNIALPGNIITFGLSIESEAAQVAAYAFADASSRAVGRRPRAAIVHDGSPASQRSVGAFIDAWHLHGGEFYEPIQTSSGSIAPMRALLRQVEADVYFVSSPLDTAAMRAVGVMQALGRVSDRSATRMIMIRCLGVSSPLSVLSWARTNRSSRVNVGAPCVGAPSKRARPPSWLIPTTQARLRKR